MNNIICNFTVCCIFLIVINITDIKGYKIKNSTILPTVVIGIILGIINHNMLDCLLGMLLPLILFPLYVLRMLGAGDIKAMCAIGSLVGFHMSIEAMILTFLSGGVIAIVFMICNGNFIERFKYLFEYLKMCFITRKIAKYNFGASKKSYFRFSYAITAGTLLIIVNNYICII